MPLYIDAHPFTPTSKQPATRKNLPTVRPKASAAQSWAALFQENQCVLVKHLQRMAPYEDACDIAQDAVLRLISKKVPYEGNNPRALLFKTATNLALNHIRGEKRRKARDELYSKLTYDEKITAPNQNPEASTDAALKINICSSSLNELPNKCKKAYLLYRFTPFTQVEIAANLGVSASMIEKYITRANAACRSALSALEKS